MTVGAAIALATQTGYHDVTRMHAMKCHCPIDLWYGWKTSWACLQLTLVAVLVAGINHSHMSVCVCVKLFTKYLSNKFY